MKKKIKEVLFWIVSAIAALSGFLFFNRKGNKANNENEKLEKELEKEEKKTELNKEELETEREKTDQIINEFNDKENKEGETNEEIDSDTADDIIYNFLNE
jgi:uncharacterized protein HemX